MLEKDGVSIDYKEKVVQRLNRLGISPNENLGQHFLIDGSIINLLSNSVQQGNTVIEVGAGVGQLTEALAERTSRVIAVEIDRRYEPVLAELTTKYPLLSVIYRDVLTLDFTKLGVSSRNGEGVQIIASLPYHITEPFLKKIISFPMESATMVLGKRYADSLRAQNEDSTGFGHLTLLSQTFFDTDILAIVGKESFLPPPRTDSCVVGFIPRDEREIRSNRRDFLLARLFRFSKSNTTVRSGLKEGLDEFEIAKQTGVSSKRERHKKSRAEIKSDLKRIINDYNRSGDSKGFVGDIGRSRDYAGPSKANLEVLGIPSPILDKPFSVLNNQELKILSRALRQS